MPHEVMNASRGGHHNESDIPEIRVKTAYNGQVCTCALCCIISGKVSFNKSKAISLSDGYSEVEARKNKWL